MSICINPLQHPYSHAKPFILKPNIIVTSLSEPNIVVSPVLHPVPQALNHGLLSVQEVLGLRPKLRVDFEAKIKGMKSYGYKRLRCNSIIVSAPNAEQAELFIQAIHDFAASLNGKWLAPRPESAEDHPNQQDTPTPGPKQGQGGD